MLATRLFAERGGDQMALGLKKNRPCVRSVVCYFSKPFARRAKNQNY
jgi:hypothetical protein